MDQQPHQRRDRYDISGNVEGEVVDAEQQVLKNKRGFTDPESLQQAEEEGLVFAYEVLLREVRTDTRLSSDLIRYIHAQIFGALYEWAGRWRTVWIKKPGVTWPPPDFLDQAMQAYERDTLAKHPAESIDSDDAFCAAAGELQGEFLVIHPFREGNARTIKLLTDLLAVQTGRPLLNYDQSEAGQARYIDAARAAFKRRYDPMAALIGEALVRAEKSGQDA